MHRVQKTGIRNSENGIRPGQWDFRAKDMGYGEVLWGTFQGTHWELGNMMGLL